jgi:hypothetical protein
MPRRRSEQAEKSGQLRAADPFDLIRLLARSQHDPRKAVAELVQNSLDAGARRVIVVRYQHKRVRCLSVRDDGEGVLPELTREEALTSIATNIGHSRKRDLSVKERYRLLLQGKYGIGLLGFWSVGRRLEMRTKVGAEPAFVLRLEEDSPRYVLHRDRRELELGDTWTEVVVVGLHDAAARQLGGARLSQYLGEELRGQLLGREVELLVIDLLARGKARREFRVTPRRFEGVPLADLTALEVPDHGQARLELCYLPPGLDEPGRVSLSAGGTIVVEDLGGVPGLERSPWTSGRLVGVVDFPRLEVAPGARRGFVPDAAASALIGALRALESQIVERLERFEAERHRENDEELLRQLRKLFSDLGRRLPHYELFEVAGHAQRAAEPTPETRPGGGEEASAGSDGEAVEATPAELEVEPGEQAELFPPGPLASVAIGPAACELEAGRARRLHAFARDERGRRIPAGVRFHWRVERGWALGTLIAIDDGDAPSAAPRPGADVLDDGRGVRFLAGDATGTVALSLLAVEGDREARAAATIEIVPRDATRADLGIPEPHPVHAPAEPWRSRFVDGRWEYNSGHRDYLATVGDSARKLRYIATLFAKELVQRRSQRPEIGTNLEQMIEVLSWVERKLSIAGRGRRPRPA